MATLKLLFAFVLLTILSETLAQKKVVCYYGSWSTYRPGDGKCTVEDIDPTKCSHLIYTFVGLNEDGTIRILDPWCDLPDGYGLNGFGKFYDLKKRNPSVKTLLAIGGWNEGSERYSRVMNDETLRKVFVKDAVNFVQKYKFDGLDFDWEYPNQRGGQPTDKQAYVDTIRDLKEAFKPHGLLLSSAVAAAKSSASQSYLIPEVSKHLDIINLMAYDLHGAWDNYVGHNSPLFPRDDESEEIRGNLNVEACLKYWLDNGADPEKIVLGMPLYGRNFKLYDSKQIQPGAHATGPGPAGPYTAQEGVVGYNEIVELLDQGYTKHWDNQSLVPFLVKGDIWVTYDDEHSIALKTEYVVKMGLGGVMVWSVETDDLKGKSTRKFPLLSTINEVLNGQPIPSTTTSKPIPTTTSGPEVNPPTTSQPCNPGTNLCTKEGFTRDPNNCAIFYSCVLQVDGSFIAYKYECPADLYFNENILQCDWKENVDC